MRQCERGAGHFVICQSPSFRIRILHLSFFIKFHFNVYWSKWLMCVCEQLKYPLRLLTPTHPYTWILVGLIWATPTLARSMVECEGCVLQCRKAKRPNWSSEVKHEVRRRNKKRLLLLELVCTRVLLYEWRPKKCTHKGCQATQTNSICPINCPLFRSPWAMSAIAAQTCSTRKSGHSMGGLKLSHRLIISYTC